MSSPNPLRNPELEFKSLLVLVLVATLLFALILWPFFGSVCWAVFIAIVFWPLHQRFLRGSRGRPNTAALASLTVILLIVILPMAMLTASVTQEASVFVGKLRDKSSAVSLADAKGRPRILLQVKADGAAAIQFLGEDGKPVKTIAP